MRLAPPDRNPGAFGCEVRCIRCGSRRSLVDVSADLDGPAFRAYFCAGRDAFNQRVGHFGARGYVNGQIEDCRPKDAAEADAVYRADGMAV